MQLPLIEAAATRFVKRFLEKGAENVPSCIHEASAIGLEVRPPRVACDIIRPS